MPVFLEGEGSFPYVLESDRSKEKPPTFLLRVLNGRKRRELACDTERLQKVETAVEAIDISEEIAKKVVVGWENINVAFSPESIFDVIDAPEARELLYACLAGNKLTVEDKKKLELQI